MAQYMVRTGDGREIGPLAGREIRAKVRSGELKPTDMLRPAEGGRWRPLASVPGLATELGAAADRELPGEPSLAMEPLAEPPPTTPPPATPAADATVPVRVESDVIDLGFADRVLRLGFAIGRAVSVVVIVLAVIGMLGAIAVFALNELQAVPPIPAPRTIAPPQVQEFVTLCAPPTGGSSQSPRSGRSPSSVAGTLDACSAWRPRVQHVCRALSLPTSAEDILCSTVRSFDLDDREPFLDGLVRFTDAWASLTPKPAGCNGAQAVDWYIESYRSQVTARAEAAANARHARDAFLLLRETRRTQAIVAAGASLGALVSFLVLPLLIQIERNTRSRRTQASS